MMKKGGRSSLKNVLNVTDKLLENLLKYSQSMIRSRPYCIESTQQSDSVQHIRTNPYLLPLKP